MDAIASPFRFACPECGGPLEQSASDVMRCPAEGRSFSCVRGVWRFLSLKPGSALQQFLDEYQTVRQAEGRGSLDAAYYHALPYADLSGRFSSAWQIRAQSFQTFLERVLLPQGAGPTPFPDSPSLNQPKIGSLGIRMISKLPISSPSSTQQGALQARPLNILDLGAGNGWLSNRLAQRGHHLAAVDLTADPLDGLEARRHYAAHGNAAPFTALQADFHRLPLQPEQVDLAVFNAAFHYSTSYETALREILRVLRPTGRVVILDTPLYPDDGSGERMVAEREALFRRRYGFPSNALPLENFLTPQRLTALSETLGLDWQVAQPRFGPRWAVQRLLSRLRSGHAAARFPVILGRRVMSVSLG